MGNISSTHLSVPLYAGNEATVPLLQEAESSSSRMAEGHSTSRAGTEPAVPNLTLYRQADRARLVQSLDDEALVSSASHEWPALTCTFMISPDNGEVKWDGKSGRQEDAAALGSLFAELNRSAVFRARMRGIASRLPTSLHFDITYRMGESMDQLYDAFRSQFTVRKVHLWKDADHAAQRRGAAPAAAAPALSDADLVEHDLKGMSVLSAALCGIAQQGSAWDAKTGRRDYASMAEVSADITIGVPAARHDDEARQPSADVLSVTEDIQAAMTEELQQPCHAAFRALQANIHARYQAGKIEHSWKALAGSMIGGGVYSLGMMMLNNHINRSMIPASVQEELGLDKQSGIQKVLTDVSEDLLPIATPWQKFLMTLNPSWQLGSWEIFDNAILDAVLGDDEDEVDDEAPAQAPTSSVAGGDEESRASWTAALWKAQERMRTGLSDLSLAKVRSGLTSAAVSVSEMAGQMVSSAPFAVPAGIISGVLSWPDKAIEIWKPGPSGVPFKAGFKLAATSPVSSLACSSGFFLKMGEAAAETEAAVLQALKDKLLAWPERNPFDASREFDRSDLEQVKRAVWDMSQDQLNNEPDALAVRLSVPMEFLSGVLQGGISMIPGMNQAVSFALDTLFFGPGELLWMTITGAVSNHANERELRSSLAEVERQCRENNASPKEVQHRVLQYLLNNKLISKDALRQWQQQTVSMLGGALIHQIYERSADLKNAGRIGARTLLVDVPRSIDAALPEPVQALKAETGRIADEVGMHIGAYAGKAVDAVVATGVNAFQSSMQYIHGAEYQRDEQTTVRYAETLKALPENAAAAIADMLMPAENNMRIRARLPYESVLAPSAAIS